MKPKIIQENTFEKARNEINKVCVRQKDNKKSKQVHQNNKNFSSGGEKGGEENMNLRKNSSTQKSQEIIFTSNNDDLNRKVLEKLGINILLINQSNRKDRQKQRDSGFNQVLAKIAKKNKVTIGINFDEIIESSPEKRKQILARIKQNIKLCNKNKLKMKFITTNPKNNRNLYDLKSLGLILGMPTWMTKSL